VNRWIVLALAAATILAYAPALRAPFVMDDEITIDAAASWSAPEQLPTAGRPVVLGTLAANYALNDALGVDQRRDPDGPNKAIGYRLFNLMLHLLTGALLFGVVRRAMRESTIPADWRALADPLAGVVCALWLLHPIQSEVVNYIVQRSEALASLAYLAALSASQRAWDAAKSSRAGWYAVAVAACVAGMLSKEIIITAPLMVMLYDRAFRLPSWRSLLRPGDGRGLLYAAMWVASIGTYALFEAGARGATAGFASNIGWLGYLYSQCWAVAHYLRLIVWPVGLSVDYGFQPIRGLSGLPGAILLTALAVGTIVAWTRVSRFGWLAFLGSWFFIVLAPSSSIVPVASEVAAERRVYLAIAAVLVLAVVGAEWARRRIMPRVSTRSLAGVAAAVLVALAVTTAARSNTYSSAEALWRGATQAMPDNSRALGNLGWALIRQPVPNLAAADSAFTRVMTLDPTCNFGCLQYATVLRNAGRLAEAVPVFERAMTVDSTNVVAERSLAFTLMKMGESARAIPHLEHIVAKYPTMDHLVMLGVAYLSVGRRDDAFATLRRTEELDNGSAEMRRISERIQQAARHPEALPQLRALAWELAGDQS
jgi:tetratricopeptide (TPR) repeat protein